MLDLTGDHGLHYRDRLSFRDLTVLDDVGLDLAHDGLAMLAAAFAALLLSSLSRSDALTFGLFGSAVAGVVSFFHLCIGYGVLGQIVARKEP